MSFSPETMALVRRAGEKARATLANRRHESSKDKMEASVAASETTGAAFACGVANGRHGGERGEVTLGPKLPADFATGVALHAVAMLLGHDSDPEPHTAALGTGALAACAYRYGERLGASMRRAASAVPVISAPRPALGPSPVVGETFTVTLVPPSTGGAKR